jgi:hypothetical protein
MEKQSVLHILGVCLWPYLSSMHSACTVLYCNLWSVWLYHTFSTLSHIWHDFRRSVIEHKMCVLISVQDFSELSLILRRTQRDIFVTIHSSSRKVSFFFSDFNEI